VYLRSATLLLQMSIETDSLRVATGVVTSVYTEIELRNISVKAAVSDLGSDETFTAIIAREVAESCIEFEEDLLPREVLLLTQEHHEFVDVPRTVSHMLGDD